MSQDVMAGPESPRRGTVMLKASWAAALILVCVGAGSGAAEAGPLRVADARGRVVGTVIGLEEGFADILVDTSGPSLAFRVGRDGLEGSIFSTTVFASTDCTGPPLLLDLASLLPPGINLLASTGGLTPTGALVAPTADPPAVTMVQSVWMTDQPARCESSPPAPLSTLATTVVGDLSGLVLPFTIAGAALGGAGSVAREPVRTPVAVDGAGQPLGPLAGTGTLLPLPFAAWALFDVGGRPAPVLVDGARPILSTALAVYAANDCTGTPFLATGVFVNLDLFPTVAVAANGHLVQGTGPAGPLAIGSVWLPVLSATPCQVVMGAPPLDLLTTSEVVDLSGRPAPFRMALDDPAGALGSRRRLGPLTVVDATGVVVGPGFVSTTLGAQIAVLIRVGRRMGEALVSTNRIGGSQPGRFETDGCNGRVLVEAPPPAGPFPLYPPTALGPGGILHSADGPFDIADLRFTWDVETGTCISDPRGPSIVQETSVLVDVSWAALPFSAQ